MKTMTRSLFTLLATLTLLLPSACSNRSKPTIASGLPEALKQAAEKTGQRIASEIPAGRILFLHAELSTPLADAMRDGLKKGLGGKLQLAELGPAQLPGNFVLMPGPDILAAALKQHSDCTAVVSTIAITDDTATSVAPEIPPLYILNWPKAAAYNTILRHPKCRGGMFYSRTAAGPVFEEIRNGS